MRTPQLYNRTVCFSDISSHPVPPRTFSFGFFLSALYQSLASAEETSNRSVWLSGLDHCERDTHWFEYEETAERGKYAQRKAVSAVRFVRYLVFFFWFNFTVPPHATDFTVIYGRAGVSLQVEARSKGRHTHTHPISKQRNSKTPRLRSSCDAQESVFLLGEAAACVQPSSAVWSNIDESGGLILLLPTLLKFQTLT